MQFDIVIIGSGIVGLATGLSIKKISPGVRLAILEKEMVPAMHQTGNNSGVIHSGLYYKPGSLKALNCITGYSKLIDFCTSENIPFERCGKLVVATRKEELPRLDELYERGLQNGLPEIKKVPAEEILNYEPHVKGLAALHVPYTGIVDYRVLAHRFAHILQNQMGAEIHFSSQLIGIRNTGLSKELVTPARTFTTRLMINTAGLHSDQVALMDLPSLDIRIIPFRGEYYSLREQSRHLVNRLVYPVPDPAFPFLGVHFTKRIDGNIEAGPNAVFAFGREAYKKTDWPLDEAWKSLQWQGFRKLIRRHWKMGMGEYYRSFSKTAFTKALQKLIPSIREEDLIPGGAGIRAQACSFDGRLIDDFLIRESPFALHVLNAPSPAATASLAIGETIAGLALQKLASMERL